MDTNEQPQPGQASEDAEIPPALAAAPALTESLLVLGLLAVTAVSCWMLYGQLIRIMPEYIRQAIR